MPKPIPTLKKPTAVPAAMVEAFVAGEDVQPPPTEAVSAVKMGVVTQDGGASSAVASAPVLAIDRASSKQARTPRQTPRTGRRVETRRDGSSARKVTFYLTPELDKRLTIYAATNEVDRTEVVQDVLEKFLRKSND